MVDREGLEPSTLGLRGLCSNRLSYRSLSDNDGWDSRIRTYEYRIQSPRPYHLAISQWTLVLYRIFIFVKIFLKIEISQKYIIILTLFLNKYSMSVKKISIELLQDVAHMGRKWDIIEVSSAQARNSLIPKKIAIEVTPERLKKLEQDKKRAQDQARERLEKAFEIQRTLEWQEFHFSLKGKWDKIFGGLDEHQIISTINKKFGIHFEKRDVKLPNKTHIKTAGRHLVYLHITHDTIAKIFIEITIDEK